jgi:nitrogen fixation NifU-like protein
MSDLQDLYQDFILDHAKHPRNNRFPKGSNREAEGYNPLCGDRLTVKLREQNGVVEEVGFQGQGCALCVASASAMTESVAGKTRPEAEQTWAKFRAMVLGEQPTVTAELPPRLAAFHGVSDYPMRVKCVTLPWHTLAAALSGESTAVSTESE